MAKRARYGGEGCGWIGLDYACAHIAEISSANLLPIQADFMTKRGILRICVAHTWLKRAVTANR